MKELRMNFQTNSKGKKRSVQFVAPIEMILTGFKLSYVSPERLEEKIFQTLEEDQVFKQSTRSDCLEESILNSGQAKIKAKKNNTSIEVNLRKA